MTRASGDPACAPQVISRFAPAPTGYLHVGHVVNAIFVWGVTRAAGGRVLLRIEDHDQQRCRPVYEAALLDDLAWLGFVPDEPALTSLRVGSSRYRQRDRADLYVSALDTLRSQRRVYACACSRRELLDVAEMDHGSGEIRYPGTCASRGLDERPGRGLRVRLDEGDERFDDLRHGLQVQRPATQCGDVLARDRAGNWTYQFAVVVDDFEMGVTLVVRGDDLLESTGRQLQLARLLGRRSPPVFLHHGLVMKHATQKLSKADGDTSIRALRARGETPEQIIGRAAVLAGLSGDCRPRAASEVETLPTLAALGDRALAVLRADR